MDGAAFGTTFPHLFLMTFSNLVPDPLQQDSAYIPRVFGFRVHMSVRLLALGANNRQRDASDNNKRLSFVGRRSETTTKDSADRTPRDSELAETPEDGTLVKHALDTTTASSQIAKGTAADSMKPARGSNEENSTRDEDGSKKSRSGKRKIEGDSGSKKSEGSNGNGYLDTSSKRRRKSDSEKG